MTAVLSSCGTYRYALWRPLQRQLPPRVDEEGEQLLFVLLNPSTANDVEDDPTIRRCLGFARREGFARLCVANLYALRATGPAQLAFHPDPIGPLNDEWISQLVIEADLIVAGWGASRYAQPDRIERVRALLRDAGRRVCCLGMTEGGRPRHPLYLRTAEPLVDFTLEVAV